MPEVIPIRQGYRDKLWALAIFCALFATLVLTSIRQMWFTMPDHQPWRVAILVGLFGPFIAFLSGGAALIFRWLWRYRGGRMILDSGGLTLAGRRQQESIQLVDVLRIQWTWAKGQARVRGPIRFWARGQSISMDLDMFPMAGRERLVEWLDRNLPADAKQIGVDEFAAWWARRREYKGLECLRHPGWYLRAVVVMTSLAAFTGLVFGLGVCTALPELPIEMAPPASAFGRIVMRTPLDWALLISAPMSVLTLAGLAFAAVGQWLGTYTERDVFAPEPLAPGPS